MTKQQHIEQVTNRIDECDKSYSVYSKKYKISIFALIVLIVIAVAFVIGYFSIKEVLFVYDLVLIFCIVC